MPYQIIRKFSGERYLLLGRFRPKSVILGEMYAFGGRFRPKYLELHLFLRDKILLI